MTQMPFPTLTRNSINIKADGDYFETQCTRYFKGQLKDIDDESKLAYILLWLNSAEFDSSYKEWTSPVRGYHQTLLEEL